MKQLHPEDPRLTAYVLGELPAHEQEEMRRAAESNPALQGAITETAVLADLIQTGFRTESHELGEARREAIRRAGRRPRPENLVSLDSDRKWIKPAAWAAAAAVLVASAVWVLQQIPVGSEKLAKEEREAARRLGARTEILLRPAPRPAPSDWSSALPAASSSLFEGGNTAPPEIVAQEYAALRTMLKNSPEAFGQSVQEAAHTAELRALAQLPPLVDNPFVPTREVARSEVPLIAGSAGYHLVERFVRTDQTLPPKNGVRIEELINRVVYEDEGDADLDGIKLGAELVRCPWDSDAILMGLLLYNGSEATLTRDAVLQVEIKPDHIRSYRLLGYARVPEARGDFGGAVAKGLPPGKSNLVLYQLEPLEHEVFRSHRVLARVGLRVDNQHPRGLIVPVTSPPRDWVNASNNLQTAIALGAWGMLLRDSPYAGDLDSEMVERLAQEAKAGAEEGDLIRREALQLAIDSLALF